jgi:hypothetical protein
VRGDANILLPGQALSYPCVTAAFGASLLLSFWVCFGQVGNWTHMSGKSRDDESDETLQE